MIKGTEIYPKTPRVPNMGDKVYLTEKLDGANLVFMKKDGELYIAQRKTIFSLNELEDAKTITYKGLYQWLKDYGITLRDNLHEGSAICGEWLGMGAVKYLLEDFDKRFYMFAKANFDENFALRNLIYDHTLFIYPFEDQTIPVFIGIVPEAYELASLPNKEYLDSLYARYCEKVGRPVEGFVINYKNIISKYVRMKNGKVIEYSDMAHKSDPDE